MNRRGFIGMMAGGVAVGAAVRTFPFRVYSFPTDIKIASASEFPAWMYSAKSYLFNPDSPDELARLMGAVEKEKQGVSISCRGGVVRTKFPEPDHTTGMMGFSYGEPMEIESPELRLFSDEYLAQVDWA